ncbi:MAG: DUF427 domain-containing protein [Solirubrobacteraceae bacterium]
MAGHEITTAPAGATVRVEIDGEVIAESTDALALEETGSPTRYYLPREDVRVELLPSDHHSHCPFKGEASYHSIGEHRDVVWYYPEPSEGVADIRDRVAFWKVDLFVDGEKVA